MIAIARRYADMTRREKFMVILGAIALLTLLFSVIARVMVFEPDNERPIKLAILAPMTGEQAFLGQSLQQGAQLYVDEVNKQGGIKGRVLQLEILDDKGRIEDARPLVEELASSNEWVAVIGHGQPDITRELSPLYDQQSLPLISTVSLSEGLVGSSPWLYSTMPNLGKQTRFLANYSLNVLGQTVVSIVSDGSEESTFAAQTFSETYESFKTKTNYRWDFDRNDPNLIEKLKGIADDIRSKVDTGAVFLAVDSVNAARLIKYIRDTGARNNLIGLASLATDSFNKTLDGMIQDQSGDESGAPAKAPKSKADYLDGLTLTSPLMFDTAGEEIQNFKNAYIDRYDESPDWMSAHAYSAASMLGESLKKILSVDARISGMELRQAVAGALNKIKLNPDEESEPQALSYFQKDGEAESAVLIGVYSGENVVSALTQLQPILGSGSRNYIAEFRKGRVLFVNDRFMYKTNVVYTGVQIGEISEVNLEEGTAQIEFDLWFRFRGDFDPQDIQFKNAVDQLEIGDPVIDEKQGDMTYRLYRIEGKFFMNFQDKSPAYGQHLVGLSFSHSNLNKDNLQYVVDFIGLDLTSGRTVEDSLNDTRALNPALGWLIRKAWIAQDIQGRSTLGSPKYVGHTGSAPEFSNIDFGIVIQRDEFAFKNIIPSEYFAYLAIFGLLGYVFAIVMDRRAKGGFWNFHSWLLRLIAWPALLLAVGNILLDFSAQNLSGSYTDMIALSYQAAWWIVPAILAALAIERFVWIPLEGRTGRIIPNVIRVFVKVLVYSFAGLGILAFVLGETITSLLATSGLLAMIIGLAVQSNIANIFSGIILNIERPFSVNDWIQVDDLDEGKVIDITWRTTRLLTRDNVVISIPNGGISESNVINYSNKKAIRLEVEFLLTTGHQVDAVLAAMDKALLEVPGLIDSMPKESVFLGTQIRMAKWVDVFEVEVWMADYADQERIEDAVLAFVWDALRKAGFAPSASGKLEKWLPFMGTGVDEADSEEEDEEEDESEEDDEEGEEGGEEEEGDNNSWI